MQHAITLKPIQLALALSLAATLVVLVTDRGADAGPKTIATVSGGPVTTPTFTDDEQVGNDEFGVTIPLNGSPSYTFTQKAG